MNIVTNHIYPPIPIRDYDFKAIRKEDADEERPQFIGWGATEQDAIKDLIDQLEESGL